MALFLVVVANAEAAAAVQAAGGKQLIPHAWVIEGDDMEEVQDLTAGSAHVVFDVSEAPRFAASNISDGAAELLARNARRVSGR
jgi:hypothetical protein